MAVNKYKHNFGEPLFVQSLNLGNAIYTFSNDTSKLFFDGSNLHVSGIASVGGNLNVSGNVRINGGLYDSNNNVGSASSVLSSTGSGLRWIAQSQLDITSSLFT